MHPSRRTLTAGLFALSFVALHGNAPQQPPSQTPPAPGTPPASTQPQRPQTPPFRTETNFVRVDVYPTHGGVPVQDLTAADFELQEDGAPQAIDTFEHVLIRPAGPQDSRIDPSSPSVANQMAADAHRRVFIIYLDTEFVSIEGSHNIAEPLISLLTRILGPDDLVGLMTPGMTAQDITLGSKTEVIEQGLRKNWPWGRRFSIIPNEEERKYEECYPPMPGEGSPSALAKALIDHRRERIVLDSLRDLIRHLGSIREGRTAVLTVTEGWLLYKPDSTLTQLRKGPGGQDPIPGVPPISVGPDGKLTTKDKRNPARADQYECDTQRMDLAMHDDEVYFRDILGEANHANVSFYPIDPRGLPAFDTPIGPDLPLGPVADAASLRTRQEAMRTLAAATDGIAVMNSNDLDKGLRRLADDLTSYYLLGYYSTNTKLDGRFRTIRVRVKRPGVEVRARKGYVAPTRAEVAASRAAAPAPVPDSARAVTAALGTLSSIVPDGRLRLHGVAAPGAEGMMTVWVEGELPSAARGEVLPDSVAIDIDVKAAGGGSGAAHVELRSLQRAFLTPVAVNAGAGAAIEIRARLRATTTMPANGEMVRIQAPPGGAPMEPLLFRRGPITGNQVQPAADRRFSRRDRLHLETAVPAGAPGWTGALLDRAGTRLPVPVSVAERTDAATGQRWLTADIVLAPLGTGDYIAELSTGSTDKQQKTLVAFRVEQ